MAAVYGDEDVGAEMSTAPRSTTSMESALDRCALHAPSDERDARGGRTA